MFGTRLYSFVAVAGAAPALAAADVLLFEDFNDGAGASRWSVASQQEVTATVATSPDGTANLAFDYSTLGIAAPTGSTGTIGAFIQVNNTDQAGDEGETYIISPNGFNLPAGDWRVDADMFVYNDGGAGTTELGMIGAYLNNADPIAPYQYGSRGGPLAFIYSGEGGSSADFASFKAGDPDVTLYNARTTGPADYNNVPAGSIPGWETGVSGSNGPAGTNAAGAWVDLALEKVGDAVTWYVNGVEIDNFDNSTGPYTTGNLFLGTTDPFNSSNAGGGAVIDNVTVTAVPEPATLSLLCLNGLALLGRRRRRRA